MNVPIKIELNNETGLITIDAPLHDKILCLGILELAKTIVINHKERPMIETPRMVFPPTKGN